MPRAFLVKSAVSRPSQHQPYVRPWADNDEGNDENNNSGCVVNAMSDENRVPLPVVEDAGRRVSAGKSSSPLCDSTTMPFSEDASDGYVTPAGSRLAAGRNRRPFEDLSTNVIASKSATPDRRVDFRYHSGQSMFGEIIVSRI